MGCLFDPSSPPRKSSAPILIGAGVLLALLLLTKLPSLASVHAEGDEMIYKCLAKNLRMTGSYTLRGSPVLKYLSQPIYDKPFFHHPPMLIFLILPLATSGWPDLAVVVSWFGHLLVCVAVLLFLLKFLKPGSWRLIFLVMLLVVLDPLLQFCSQKIWNDSLLAGLSALSVVFFFLSLEEPSERKRKALAVGSGLLLGCAILTKVPAIILFPVYALALLRRFRRREWKEALLPGLCFLIPCLVVCAPWFVKFHGYYGRLLPDWLAADSRLIKDNAFVRMVKERPPYYFFKEAFLLCPIFAVPLFFLLKNARRTGSMAGILAFWFVWVLAVFTWQAVFANMTYQMRYLTMAWPPMYLLLGLTLERLDVFKRPVLLLVVLIGLAWHVATVIYYAAHLDFADILSLAGVLTT
jgi:4-amino-4-deoxy-L-arabinose transferase-like glycosyltransferase